MAVTKRDLDKYFSVHYEDILEYINKSFSKREIKNEEPDFFFSETYLYLLNRIDELQTNDDIKKYISTFIYKNTFWINSSVREAENYSRRIRMIEYNASDFENEFEDEDEVDSENKVNEYKAVIEMYYASLTSLEKKAVWEIYFVKGHRTIVTFAEYINMSRTVAARCIKELKSDIREYYERYKMNKASITKNKLNSKN